MSTVPTYYYYIRSQLNGLALDVEASNPLPGAWVTTWEKTDINSQKWFDDPETGTIRSKLNSFCLDIEGGRLVLNPYQPGKQDQLWERKGSAIAARHNTNLVLDIAERNAQPRAKVIKKPADFGKNQSWTFELV